MSITRSVFELGYEFSPIIFVDGAFASFPGGLVPIIALTQTAGFVKGLLSGSLSGADPNNFARFVVQTGGFLANNAVAMYPFANQTIAANAVVTQPLSISVTMLNPANTDGGYVAKLATMTLLKKVIDLHTQMGGTYTVATPSYIYTGLLLTSLQDVAPPANTKQVQSAWSFNFIQPLLSESQATAAKNALMGKLDSFTQNNSAWTDPSNAGASTAANGFNVPSLQSVLGAIGNGASSITSSVGGAASSVASSLGL